MVTGFKNNLFEDSRGLTTTEYLLILLGVVALAASAWSLFTDSTSETTNEAGIAIRDMEGRAGNAALAILGQTQGVGGHLPNGRAPQEIGTLPEGAPSASSETSNSGNSSNSSFSSDDVGGDFESDNRDYFGYTGGGIGVPPLTLQFGEHLKRTMIFRKEMNQGQQAIRLRLRRRSHLRTLTFRTSILGKDFSILTRMLMAKDFLSRRRERAFIIKQMNYPLVSLLLIRSIHFRPNTGILKMERYLSGNLPLQIL